MSLTHSFMTACDFSHVRSDVRELANTRRKKQTESQAMASFQEEKNIWEFLSLEESQLEGGKIKAYRYMNCMEKMKGEWPLLCSGKDEIGRRKMTLTSSSTSVESPASCTSFTSVPNPVSCLWVMLPGVHRPIKRLQESKGIALEKHGRGFSSNYTSKW